MSEILKEWRPWAPSREVESRVKWVSGDMTFVAVCLAKGVRPIIVVGLTTMEPTFGFDRDLANDYKAWLASTDRKPKGYDVALWELKRRVDMATEVPLAASRLWSSVPVSSRRTPYG